jgi:hypothetical protein
LLVADQTSLKTRDRVPSKTICKWNYKALAQQIFARDAVFNMWKVPMANYLKIKRRCDMLWFSFATIMLDNNHNFIHLVLGSRMDGDCTW